MQKASCFWLCSLEVGLDPPTVDLVACHVRRRVGRVAGANLHAAIPYPESAAVRCVGRLRLTRVGLQTCLHRGLTLNAGGANRRADLEVRRLEKGDPFGR